MATGAGLVAPGNFSIRDPRKKQQMNGRIVNSTDNYGDVGGLFGPGKWKPSPAWLHVEKPTGVRAASVTAQRNGWNWND